MTSLATLYTSGIMSLFRTSGQSFALILFFLCLTLIGLIRLLPLGPLGSWAQAHIVWVYLAGLSSLGYFLIGTVIARMRLRLVRSLRDRRYME